MALLQKSDVYRTFAGTCTQCGHCTHACDSLTKAGMTLGDIAKALLAAQRGAANADEVRDRIQANEALVQAVRGCFFCTSCKNTCFAHNDVCGLIYAARVDFLALGLIPRDTWTSVLVDQEWDIFTAYRAVHGIGYPDLTRHVANDYHGAEDDCEVAFMPGCALAAYGPELTREVFGAIEELGGKTTMLDSCCGSSLKSAGFFDRALALCDRNVDEVVASIRRDAAYSVILKVDKEFPLVFETPVSTAQYNGTVGVGISLRIADFRQFIRQFFIAGGRHSVTNIDVKDMLKATVDECLRSETFAGGQVSDDVRARLLLRLQAKMTEQNFGINVTRVNEITVNSQDLDRLRTLDREIYLSEEELDRLHKINIIKSDSKYTYVDNLDNYNTKHI